ncbi:MAG: uncharacterized protein A8A55_3557, partial [Amphiamblys sp. WSBS2006]
MRLFSVLLFCQLCFFAEAHRSRKTAESEDTPETPENAQKTPNTQHPQKRKGSGKKHSTDFARILEDEKKESAVQEKSKKSRVSEKKALFGKAKQSIRNASLGSL